MRLALLLSALCGSIALLDACKDGVTPDCTTDPTVCSPIEGDVPDAAADAPAPATDGGSDASDAGGGDRDAADASG